MRTRATGNEVSQPANATTHECDWGLTLGARCYAGWIGRAPYARLFKADVRLARAPKSSMKERGRSSPLVRVGFRGFRLFVGRRVRRAGSMTGRRPPPGGGRRVLTPSLDASRCSSRKQALLVVWGRVHRAGSVPGGRPVAWLPVIYSQVCAWWGATVTGRGQSRPRPRHRVVGVRLRAIRVRSRPGPQLMPRRPVNWWCPVNWWWRAGPGHGCARPAGRNRPG
ncbi:hypothetical protein LX86_006872 [Lentzea aerocolonigenes]|nr:hypothetical protein [Lentzea aerocolonigenes]